MTAMNSVILFIAKYLVHVHFLTLRLLHFIRLYAILHRFVERQAEDQLAMLQGRARMATTLVNAKEEFHKRNGGTIVQSDWSYSGLAGKTMSPVWNSKVSM